MNGATYSQASFHVELHKCIRRARGDQWTINFAKRLAVVSPNDHALQRALALIRVRQLLPHPRRSLRPISIRGAGSAILLNARTTLSGLSRSLLWLRARRGSLAGHRWVHTLSERASERASGRAGAAAGELADSSCRLRARVSRSETGIASLFASPNSVFPTTDANPLDSWYELSDASRVQLLSSASSIRENTLR